MHKKSTTFSPQNVLTLSERLALYFKNAEKLHLIHDARAAKNCHNNCDVIAFLNPIHPYLIHMIGKKESAFLNSLPEPELKKLIDQLSKNNAQYLIFENKHNIPAYLFQQDKLHLVTSSDSLEKTGAQLGFEINDFVTERVSQHGAFVVVFNKGILITGDSGSGKSSLLLNLIKQGHLWVADDLSLFYLDSNNQVIGHASEEFSEFIHIKGIGPVNMDKSYGQACRIPSHQLAGVIHLGNNSANENNTVSAYTQLGAITLLEKNFPMWQLPTMHSNATTLVENCAKNLILNDWNYNAVNGLENALNNALIKPKISTSREV